MKKKTAAIVALGVSIIFFIAYIVLGGFKEVEVSTVEVSGYTIAGVPYKGKASDQELMELFNQIKQYHKEGKIPGTLAAVYNETANEDKGEVDAFIGVITKDSSAVLPSKFNYRHIDTESVVRASIGSHYVVAPTPGTVKKKIINFAKENNLTLQNYMIEKYINEKSIIIEIPIKMN